MEQNQQENPVQGMYCDVAGQPTASKCTVTMGDISLSIYKSVPMLTIPRELLESRFQRMSTLFAETVTKERFVIDFQDLCKATGKINKTQMSLRSGDKITTYALGQPEADKDGFLYLSPSMPEWWSHPNVAPVVQSIQEYLPDFKPWLLSQDQTLGVLFSRSTLLS